MTYKEAIKAIRDNYPPSHYSMLREALDMAIEALKEIERHEETFEWCENCKEYDQNEHCCHRWTKLIRDTVDEINENTNEKYRWHDLRKNPNDLPNDSFRHVLVKVVHRYSDSDGYYDYDMGFIHSDGIEKRWGFKSSKNEEIYKVIAWSEINPFEVEE